MKQWLVLAALGLAWGTTWVAVDTLAESVPPLHGAAARFGLASLLCIPVIVGKRMKLPRGRALRFIFLLSCSMIVAPFLLLLWAQPHVPSATVAVLYAAMPLLVVLMTQDAPRSAMQASIVGLGAMTIALGASFSMAQARGAAVVLLAVGSIGVSSMIARRELGSVHPIMVTALLSGSAGLLMSVAGAVLEREQTVQWNRGAIGSVVFLAAVAGAPAYAAYFWLLQRLEAYQAVTVQWIEPVVAMLESAVLLHAGLSFNIIAGSVVTLVSLVVVLRARSEDDNIVSLLGT